ncbi:MAG: DUF3576 domain-containing protein [Alphaproteobacteria bacterium]
MNNKKTLPVFLTIALGLAVSACAGKGVEPAEANPTPQGMKEGPGVLSGKSGNILDAFRTNGGKFAFEGSEGTASLAVNGFMWRAALETMSFLPLQNADSTGGVINTDWGTNPADANERVKGTVYLFGKKISPTAVQVKLFKQRKRDGAWEDVPVAASTQTELEDAILTRARKLHVESQAPTK